MTVEDIVLDLRARAAAWEVEQDRATRQGKKEKADQYALAAAALENEATNIELEHARSQRGQDTPKLRLA